MARNHRMPPERYEPRDRWDGPPDKAIVILPTPATKIIHDGVAILEVLNKRVTRQSPKTMARMGGTHFAELSREDQASFSAYSSGL